MCAKKLLTGIFPSEIFDLFDQPAGLVAIDMEGF